MIGPRSRERRSELRGESRLDATTAREPRSHNTHRTRHEERSGRSDAQFWPYSIANLQTSRSKKKMICLIQGYGLGSSASTAERFTASPLLASLSARLFPAISLTHKHHFFFGNIIFTNYFCSGASRLLLLSMGPSHRRIFRVRLRGVSSPSLPSDVLFILPLFGVMMMMMMMQ